MKGRIAIVKTWLVQRRELVGPVVFGVLLRIFYTSFTPYYVRTYDVRGHIDYVKYVAKTFSIPSTGMGWETHQGPLYYFLSGIWVRIGNMFARPSLALAGDLQWGSFLLSIVLLCLAAAIALELFPSPRQRLERMLFVLLHAVFPVLVFASARISNDALAWPLLWAFALFLLRWWRTGSMNDWLAVAVISSLTILTKHNGYMLPPLALLCLLLRPGFKVRFILRSGLVHVGIVALFTGWFFYSRIHDGFLQNGLLKPGLYGMGPDLQVPNVLVNFLVFNPIAVIEYPFVSTFSDLYRRQFMWEHLYKTAFLGEMIPPAAFTTVVQVALGLGLGTLLFGIKGVWDNVRRRAIHTVPLLLIAVSHLAGLVVYRILHNCACNQDFRLVPILIIPWAYFALSALPQKNGKPRSMSIVYLGLFCVPCVAFLIAITLPF